MAIRCRGKGLGQQVVKSCGVCSKQFRTRHRGAGTARTCSRSCSQKLRWNKQPYACPTCGKEFSSRYIRKFCSVRCFHDSRRVGTDIRICKGCKSEYDAPRGSKWIRPTYCSRECYANSRRDAARVTRTCTGCHRSYETFRSNNRKVLYCSRECYLSHQRAYPNWTEYGGRKFRSKWEATFARWLDHIGMPWEYEPKRFVMSNGSGYTPDFRVQTPFGICIVELHRIMNKYPDDERKLESIRLAQAEIENFVLLDDSWMQNMRPKFRRAGVMF